jgi:hypothetical protein
MKRVSTLWIVFRWLPETTTAFHAATCTKEKPGLDLLPLRKKNSKRPVPPWIQYLLACYRKVIETTGSLLEQLLPKHIHAVTPKGFELKLALFVLATGFNFSKVTT